MAPCLWVQTVKISEECENNKRPLIFFTLYVCVCVKFNNSKVSLLNNQIGLEQQSVTKFQYFVVLLKYVLEVQ